jgi:pimeloyl-ACP methyl ester carboxylesterase
MRRRPFGSGRLRAIVLLAVVLDLPLLGWVVRRLTPEPVVERLVVHGVEIEVLRRPGRKPRPAWMFVNGADPTRRRAPVVDRLVRGLARAGYVVAVPEIPGLAECTITRRSLAATVAAARAVSALPQVSGGRVALVGASTGGGLALRAAAAPELAGRISVVATVAPFADLRKLVCLTTTSCYGDGESWARHAVTELHRSVVARSLVAALEDERDRALLTAALEDIERDRQDPLDELPGHAGAVGEGAAALLELLGNRDPERFDALYGRLPESVRAFVHDLSPVGASDDVKAPVELVVAPTDVYFPHGEALSLARALPHVHLTVTATLDHTVPTPSLTKVRDFLAFDAFVMRGLSAAA